MAENKCQLPALKLLPFLSCTDLSSPFNFRTFIRWTLSIDQDLKIFWINADVLQAKHRPLYLPQQGKLSCRKFFPFIFYMSITFWNELCYFSPQGCFPYESSMHFQQTLYWKILNTFDRFSPNWDTKWISSSEIVHQFKDRFVYFLSCQKLCWVVLQL